MIGNDIVDLNFAKIHNNWKRSGYLQRIFLESEQQMIMDSKEPDKVLWTLWSMKESVYKASLKESGERRFNPKAFLCRISAKNRGSVEFKQSLYKTRSDHQEDYIHTLAFHQNFEKDLYKGLIKIKKVNLVSEEVHMSLIKSVSKRSNWNVNSLKIKKNLLGIPELYKGGIKTTTMCSMSHHGAYGAYLTAE